MKGVYSLFEQHDNTQYFQITKCLLKDNIICTSCANNINCITRYNLCMLQNCCHHS